MSAVLRPSRNGSTMSIQRSLNALRMRIASIHWGDETALVNTDVRGRSYAPKGQTPVTCAPGKREKLSMISTVTNQGKARWMVIDGNFDAGKLIEFLEALIKDAVRKIFLILDNLRGPPFQAGESMAGGTQGPHRSLLFAQLCPRTQSRRASQRRFEARHQHKGSGAYQGELQSCCRGAYGHHRAIRGSGRAYFQDRRVKYAA